MTSFVLQLACTLVLFAAAVVTGRRGRRRLHVAFVLAALICLALTILLAERLGRGYDLEAAGWITPVHLALAKLTALSFLAPIVTGVMTWRDARHRSKHRWMVILALGLTVIALVTGTWMILAATPL